MRIITNNRDIQIAQNTFSSSLDYYAPEPIKVTIGYQSNSVIRTVKWISRFGIWAYFGEPPEGKSEGGRYWNAFGLEKPEGMVSIVCEINPPLERIRRKVAGAFVKDRNGDIWVAQRGRFNISGGMTMKFFRKHYFEPYSPVEDGNRTTEVILVGRLVSEDFGIRLRNFVSEVDRIKDLGRAANT
jgi:hypothetical protein